MSDRHLAAYLNDHLAGSVVALELLGHLETEHAGAPIAEFASILRPEIEEDRGTLQALMAHLAIGESAPRKAAAWLAEKLTDLKLRFDDRGGVLRTLEIVEALALGIDGKRCLWAALEAASDVHLALRTVDYGPLQGRARDQRRRVEPFRLESAKLAFGTPPVAEKG